MTFAEILVLLGIVAALCFLMRPLQRFIEARLYKIFKKKQKHEGKSVIDITDYSNRDK